ncbi:class E sortase [Streptomyces sp. JJ38]|uniref:class E sortase n=1 Tax=Streptomyces sp. JJ38 TaxID=2738128 RepID=UPI001C5A2AF3|nr:class E sortase [Streptomyces sp. JJ38]MBW1598855.1 class E sortase [Streptomyces sp. JJ38]
MALTEHDEAETEEDPPRSAPPRRPRGRLAAAVSVVGELLITTGLVLALFVAYSLWWTNVVADRQAAQESSELRDQWAAQEERGEDAGEDAEPVDFDPRDGIGFLHVPAMSGDDILVMPGTDPDKLNRGIAGYYEKPVEAAMPWDKSGNFSLAAHRDGHGAKFHNIHKVDEGDAVVFETKDTWYVYKVFAKLPETSKYNVGVLADVPQGSGRSEKGRYLTLTTCTPMFTSTYRYVVWAELERTEPVDERRTPPEELTEG